MNISKRFLRSLSILPITAAAIVLSNMDNHAHGCINFWVNPETGAQECLDGVAGSTSDSEPASESGSSNQPNSGNSGQNKQEDTISSGSANQQYKNQSFNILPANQLRQRTPILSSVPQLIVSGSSAAETTAAAGAAVSSEQEETAIAPNASGSNSGVPYSTSRVVGGTTNPAQAMPYRRTGKLYMAFGGNTFNSVCSASLIGRSLLLTAAHCVHEYGQRGNGWARKVKFVPAKDSRSEPYRSFESTQYLIPAAYYNGTDTCDPNARGIVCNNDIALVALNNNSSRRQAGDLVGYYGYGWDNYSFSRPAPSFAGAFGNNLFAAITQLGYPAAHDSGLKMQMNNAYGSYVSRNNLENTWLGSAMTGGSSGGPWLVNLGQNASGASYGNANARDIVVGVTSWGYTDRVTQVQGASSFGRNREFPSNRYGSRGAGNIGKLVYDACDNSNLSDWRLQRRGRCR
ncbi:trypsin-like serine protease [Leptolyngbya cf. ectocarpi LEGE 11479]|uniref:Trypsin-like serine protease n=1 Tax=Leptolyngbya cf. ectocarpi LEGE 11479 TaxID=1828722 RepID=A0A928ZUH6_LEPEC|nr:trypsin-like serine protease [Leptolyngbya ectocarpi]MBE9067679.1 trypsin-like serine protease [Leptolyngbya cf. ectocarpi LEGE 11479]